MCRGHRPSSWSVNKSVKASRNEMGEREQAERQRQRSTERPRTQSAKIMRRKGYPGQSRSHRQNNMTHR